MKQTFSQALTPHHDTLHQDVMQLLEFGDQYFLPEARELLRRVANQDRLSDDEILLLTTTALQALRAYYAEPGHSSQIILERIFHILDHEEVVRAEYNKLYTIFREANPHPAPEVDHS